LNSSLFTVMGFTMRNKFRTKSFIITSVIIALILSLGINLPYLISVFKTDKPTNVGVIKSELSLKLEQFYAAEKAIDKEMDKEEESKIKIVTFDDQGSKEANEKLLKDKIAAGDIKGYLEFGAASGTAFPKVTYKSEATMDFKTTSKLQAALNQIKTEAVAKDLLTKEQLTLILAPVPIENVQISTTAGGAGSVGEGKTQSEINMATGMVYIVIFLLFMGILITGQLIATEITAEKSSRVMEVLITSVKPTTQMFGKIIGMFLVGLSQIVLFIVVAIINITLPHNVKVIEDMNLSLNDIDPLMLTYAIIFYVLGFFLYSTLFAAVGSMVSRTEDLGQAVMPITFLSLGGFYLAMFSLTNPDTALVTGSSFIPFFTPYTMFMRIGLTDPAAWEVWLSIGLLVASILFFGWISAKIYRTGVLMYGKRPSLKELYKAMKAYKF